MLRLLVTTLLFISFGAAADVTQCFDAYTNGMIKSFLTPNKLRVSKGLQWIFIQDQKLNETEETINQIHSKIREAALKYDLDPRLVYGRMIGESLADPFVIEQENPHGHKAYGRGEQLGMFGFRGDEGKAVLKKCGVSESPRLCQVEYYIEHRLKDAVDNAKKNCEGQAWPSLSAAQKYLYLDFGRCSKTQFANTECFQSRNFQNSGACKMITEAIDWNNADSIHAPKIPLCPDYIHHVTSAPRADEKVIKKTDK